MEDERGGAGSGRDAPSCKRFSKKERKKKRRESDQVDEIDEIDEIEKYTGPREKDRKIERKR